MFEINVKAYWKNRNSDGDIFDEEGFIQWDQDNSAFYDPDGGDKDAKDFIDMQKDRLRRKGIPEERLKDGLINSFGGKILKSQGWQEGEKLGDHGICEPIAPDYRYLRFSKNLF